jgi:hypothetical protein
MRPERRKRSRRRQVAQIFAALVVCSMVLAPATLDARLPPLDTLAARQLSLRQASTEVTIDVSVSVTSGRLTQWAASELRVGAGEPLSLVHSTGERRLLIGPDSDAPVWRVVYAMLGAADPVAELQRHVGPFDKDTTRIEAVDDDFLYLFGELPQIGSSRDLGRIRRVRARLEDSVWEFRLSGELGVAGLARRIHILRGGQPYATVEVAVSEASADTESGVER